MSLEGKKSYLYRDDLKNKETLENKKPSFYSIKSPSSFLSTSPASVKQSFYGPSYFSPVGLSGNMGALPPVVETVDTSKTIPIGVPIRPSYFDVSLLFHNESSTTDLFNILYSVDNGANWINWNISASAYGSDYVLYGWINVSYAGDLWVAVQTIDNQDMYFGSGSYTVTGDYTSFYGKSNPCKFINVTSGSVPGWSTTSAYTSFYLNLNVVDSEYVIGPYFELNSQAVSYYDSGYIE